MSDGATAQEENIREYDPLPTLRAFHEDPAQIRCIVGPVGSGKTTAATWEICYYLPQFLFDQYRITQTRWVIVRNCFSADTEILTEHGWKLFPDLLPNEKVAQLSNDDKLEFVEPTYYYQSPYVGQMIGFENEGVDFLVTPNHKLNVSLRNARKKCWDKYRFRTASECFGKQNMRVKRDAKWIGTDTELSEDMFEWLGLWFAEGYAAHYDYRSKNCGGWRCVITQSENLDYVRALFHRADIPYYEAHNGKSINFSAKINTKTKPLIEKLIQCGKAITKRIPEWIKNAPVPHLSAFLKGYEFGDGCHASNGVVAITTASKGMADDLQELALKIGLAANIHLVNEAGIAYRINGVQGITNSATYSVTFTKKTQPALTATGYAGKYRGWYKEQYAGKVYCVEVPTHKVFVRRNGKCHWSSQTYTELIDTTQKTVFEWFGWGRYEAGRKTLTLKYPEGFEVEILFRSCDRPEDVKKFKSLEITGYWIDESIEVADEIKMMLKNRIGRFPRQSPVRFGIETTNPPDIEASTYRDFDWGNTPPPGPVPEGTPKAQHRGFWQPPRENEAHLRPHYYDDLLNDYADNPDWADMYVLGKPGVIVRGRSVYPNFRRDLHVSKDPLVWSPADLYRGWDNSGNCPACVVAQVPTAGRVQILREFVTDKMGIVDFTRHVVSKCNTDFPNAVYQDWGDPAGANKFSKKEGGFTSNAMLMQDAAGVNVVSSDQNFTARTQAVEQALGRIDGLLIDPSCTRLINGFLGGYCYPQIGTTGEYSDKPEKNRFSHPHDALQYLMLKLTQSTGKVMSFVPKRINTQSINRSRFSPIRRAA